MKRLKRSPYPKRVKGLELCLTVTRRGVKVYGNRQAFQTLTKWMSWIARSKEADHFSCSLVWHMVSKFTKKRNVFVLVDKDMSRVFGRGQKNLLERFELTFVSVEESDLRAFRKHAASGLLPPDWEPKGD